MTKFQKGEEVSRRIAASLALVGVVATMTVSGPAHAETGTRSATTADGRHCAINLTSKEIRCFSSFREAIAEATGGRIADAPENVTKAVADKSFEARINAIPAQLSAEGTPSAAAYVTSIEYEHRYRGDNGGASFTFYGDYPCIADGERDYEVADIRFYDPWWNDRISSFQGYNTCDVNHYQHSSFQGASTGPKRYMDSMGSMNDDTTSLTWG